MRRCFDTVSWEENIPTSRTSQREDPKANIIVYKQRSMLCVKKDTLSSDLKGMVFTSLLTLERWMKSHKSSIFLMNNLNLKVPQNL